MFEINYSGQFKKDFKKYKNNPKEVKLIEHALILLRTDGNLLQNEFKTHSLTGNYKGFLEAHIKPDLIIVWEENDKTITLTRLGSHSELFK
jgi:mRNA interferase YafQ